MADTQSNIIITASNKARATLQSVSSDFDHITTSAKKSETALSQVGRNTPGLSALDGAIGKLTGGLGGLGAVATGAGVAGAAIVIGRTALAFEEMAEQAQRSQQRLAAFAGGAGGAKEAIQAIEESTGGALSRMDAATAATRFFSMGLAKNSEEAGNMARAALMLGDSTMTAAEKINDWSLMLANQSVERLDQFGISSGQVRERILQLQAATPGLTREQAFLTAVMEQATTKMAALEAQGVQVGTETDRINAAWKDLRVEMGKPIIGVVKIVKQGAATAMEGAVDVLRAEGAAEALANERLYQSRNRLNMALQQQANVAGVAEQAVKDQAAAEVEAAARAHDMALAAASLAGIETNLANASDVGTAAIIRQAQAAGNAGGILAQYAASVKAAQLAQVGIQFSRDVGAGAGATRAFTTEHIGISERLQAGWQEAPLPTPVEGSARFLELKKIEEQLNKVGNVGVKGAQSIGSAWDKALTGMSSQVSSFADSARAASKALTPGGAGKAEDWLKPGANGPFENLFRAKDVAVRGDASQWAKVLGMDQETAKKVTEEFEAGIMSADVKALIDKQAIVDRVRLQALAQETQAAFADEIAAAAGADTRGVDELLGFTDAKFRAAGSNIGTKLKGAIDGLSEMLKAGGAGAADNMLAGLDSKESEYYSRGFNAGKQYLAGFADAQGSHSPSREMMKLGQAALEGFNMGASGGYGFGGMASGASGGSRGGVPVAYNRSVRYYEGDRVTIVVNSEAALPAVLAAQRSSKAKRLGTA